MRGAAFAKISYKTAKCAARLLPLLAARLLPLLALLNNSFFHFQESVGGTGGGATGSIGLATHRIAKYIEEKMKEQYREQARTLEQMQLQMRQQFVEKQAQLLEQLKTLDNSHSETSNGLDGGVAVNGNVKDEQAVRDANTSADLSNGIASSHANDDNDDVADKDGLFDSVASGDESGSTSHGSSRDTWDSTNAFTHERPVLTGSERSTPTPVMSMNNDEGDSDDINDLELLSQSIHIPVSEQDNGQREPSKPHEGSQPLSQTATTHNPGNGALLLASASDDNETPRNAAEPGVVSAAVVVELVVVSVVVAACGQSPTDSVVSLIAEFTPKPHIPLLHSQVFMYLIQILWCHRKRLV